MIFGESKTSKEGDYGGNVKNISSSSRHDRWNEMESGLEHGRPVGRDGGRSRAGTAGETRWREILKNVLISTL